MALSIAELTAISGYDNADVTANPAVISTPSLTASANKLYIIFAWGLYASGGTPDNFTVAGGGLGSWTEILQSENTGGGTEIRFGAFYASSASPGAGAAIALTFGNVDVIGCAYSVFEIDGHKTSGPIGQFGSDIAAGGAVNSVVPTLASATAGSALIAGGLHITNEATTVEAGWTEGEDHSGASPNAGQTTGYRTDSVADLSCTISWATATRGAGMIIEMLLATATSNGFFIFF